MELFVTYQKSTRLPIDLCHLAVFSPRIIIKSQGPKIYIFYGINSLFGCTKNQEGYVVSKNNNSKILDTFFIQTSIVNLKPQQMMGQLIGQLVTYYSCNSLPTAPPTHKCEFETLFFRLIQMFGGIFVLFVAYYQNTFSVFLLVCTGVSHIERWIREIFLSSD